MQGRVGVLLAMAGASMAFGDPILVDYGSSSAGSPDLGGTWNEVTSTDGQALVDASGAATGVSISFGGDGWIVSSNDQGSWPSGDNDWVDALATNDYIFNTADDNSTATFSGLQPGQPYRFEHVAARELGPDRIADYAVNGNFADSTPNGDDFDALLDGWDPGNILLWENAIADGNGEITLSVSEVIGFGYLSASRIELVPAPASVALAGFAFGFAGRRRR